MLPVALLACASQPALLTDNAAKAIADSVVATESTMNRAVDSLDCARGLTYIADQDPLFVSGGHVVRGHADLLHACEGMVAPRTGATFTTQNVHAYALSTQAAYVVREGEYVVRYRDGGSKSEHLVMTTVWARKPSGWQMVHLHESAIPLDSTKGGNPKGK